MTFQTKWWYPWWSRTWTSNKLPFLCPRPRLPMNRNQLSSTHFSCRRTPPRPAYHHNFCLTNWSPMPWPKPENPTTPSDCPPLEKARTNTKSWKCDKNSFSCIQFRKWELSPESCGSSCLTLVMGATLRQLTIWTFCKHAFFMSMLFINLC